MLYANAPFQPVQTLLRPAYPAQSSVESCAFVDASDAASLRSLRDCSFINTFAAACAGQHVPCSSTVVAKAPRNTASPSSPCRIRSAFCNFWASAGCDRPSAAAMLASRCSACLDRNIASSAARDSPSAIGTRVVSGDLCAPDDVGQVCVCIIAACLSRIQCSATVPLW